MNNYQTEVFALEQVAHLIEIFHCFSRTIPFLCAPLIEEPGSNPKAETEDLL